MTTRQEQEIKQLHEDWRDKWYWHDDGITLSSSIDEPDMSQRCWNVLRREGIETLSQLDCISPDVMLSWKNFGIRSVAEVLFYIEQAKTNEAKIADEELLKEAVESWYEGLREAIRKFTQHLEPADA